MQSMTFFQVMHQAEWRCAGCHPRNQGPSLSQQSRKPGWDPRLGAQRRSQMKDLQGKSRAKLHRESLPAEGTHGSPWRIMRVWLHGKGASWERAGPRDTLSKRQGGRSEFTELNLFFWD